LPFFARLLLETFLVFPFDLVDFARRAAPFFDFELLADFVFRDEAFALEFFFAGFFALPLFFEDFLLLLAGFTLATAFAATFLTAFLTFGAAEREAAARPANAPSTPPTTAPTGPATLPSTAPVAAPAVCFEIGGISMFSEDDAGVSVEF